MQRQEMISKMESYGFEYESTGGGFDMFHKPLSTETGNRYLGITSLINECLVPVDFENERIMVCQYTEEQWTSGYDSETVDFYSSVKAFLEGDKPVDYNCYNCNEYAQGNKFCCGACEQAFDEKLEKEYLDKLMDSIDFLPLNTIGGNWEWHKELSDGYELGITTEDSILPTLEDDKVAVIFYRKNQYLSSTEYSSLQDFLKTAGYKV